MVSLASAFAMALLGGVFAWAGVEHFLKFEAMVDFLSKRGFPAPKPLLAAGSIVQLIAGICLAIGVMAPYAAAVLIAFTIAASVMVLNFWRHTGPERDQMRSAFTINIAVVGGLILAMTCGR